jgi:hypothetical protein
MSVVLTLVQAAAQLPLVVVSCGDASAGETLDPRSQKTAAFRSRH